MRELDGRQARREELRTFIEAWTRKRTPADAATVLQAAGIAAAPCADTAELLADQHLRERGFFGPSAGADSTVEFTLLPWRLHPAGAVGCGPAPRLDQDKPAL
ncbi:MAG: CoA transferase [Dehalococcoidia bacterium]